VNALTEVAVAVVGSGYTKMLFIYDSPVYFAS
jgi:hypothetical protein